MPSEASCFHSAVSEGSGLRGFDPLSVGDWFPTFRKIVVSSAARVRGLQFLWIQDYWDLTLSEWVTGYRRFERLWCLQLSGSRGLQFLWNQDYWDLTLSEWVTGYRRFERLWCLQLSGSRGLQFLWIQDYWDLTLSE